MGAIGNPESSRGIPTAKIGVMAATDTTRITKPSPIVENEQGELVARRGVSLEVIRELSRIKNEPAWMTEKRESAFAIFERKPMPTWGPDLSELNFDDLVLYSPPTTGRFNSWDDVPADMKKTYEDLGIPQAEREHLAGVVGVWRQEPVYEGLKEEYAKQGILFCSMETAVRDHPDLVQKYFMTKCVPAQDNKFSALHGAVWSGGAFVYIPPGVKCDLPLQAYFRMEGAGEGTFEHTLIIADEGSEVNYIEGCTAQTYSVNSMHSAVVEIFVHEGAKARYTTVQNCSKDVYNLNTKRARVEANGTVEWVGGSMGAKVVMLYPGSYLVGEGARADHLNVGVAGKGVHKDTGAKVLHLAPNTTSNILAKSISKDGGIMGYRGLVQMGKNSQGSKARVQCDGLMMDGISRSDTWPDIQISNPHVTVAHEATVGRISDEQLFYMGTRGFTEDEAAAMIVNGFIEPVTKELPMEYAIELNRLIQLEMVGSIG
jgi:Fe-S cluster assembly protein SufB